MANLEVTKKVSFLKVWLEDIFTDELVKKIAASARAEKGKKVKAKLDKTGLTLTRSRFLQDQKTTFSPINSIKTVARNPVFSPCVMFILSDPRVKYMIIALRCASDGDATHLTNVFAEIKKDAESGNIELRKRDNGNWTLRERAAHNANKHMTEIFSERKQPNGDVAVVDNGNREYVPVLDRSKVHTNGRNHKGVYVKRTVLSSNNNNYKTTKDDDDEFVIETEVSTDPYTTVEVPVYREVREVRDEPDGPDNEMRELKTRLEKTPSYRDSRYSGIYSQPVVYASKSALPSKPVVYKTTSQPPPSKHLVYSPRTYEAKATSSAGYYTNPWVTQRNASGEVSPVPVRVSDSAASGSTKVKFDQVSLRSNTSRISRSLRASDFSIPTTVKRSIEETYPRPVVIRRSGHGQVVHFRPRPVTYHPVGVHDYHLIQVKDEDVLL